MSISDKLIVIDNSIRDVRSAIKEYRKSLASGNITTLDDDIKALQDGTICFWKKINGTFKLDKAYHDSVSISASNVDVTNVYACILPSKIITIEQYTFFENPINYINLEELKNIRNAAFAMSNLRAEVNCPKLQSLGSGSFFNTNIEKIVNLGTISSIPPRIQFRDSNKVWHYAGAFSECKNLKSAILPATCTVIGERAFLGDANLEITNFSNLLLSTINAFAFADCSKLDFTIPTTVTKIDTGAFIASGLSSAINLPNLNTLGGGAFAKTNIQTVSNLGNITNIPDQTQGGWDYYNGTFRSCKNLTTVILPSTCTSIGTYAFCDCESLNNINLSNVTTIKNSAFLNTNLSGALHLPNLTNASSFMSVFSNTKLTSVEDLGQITSIGCSNYGPFQNCALLTKIVLPATLNTINGRFFDAPHLTTVIIKNESPIVISSTVGLTNGNVSIYVPYSSDHSVLNAYKTATNWKSIKDYIFELDENGNVPN